MLSPPSDLGSSLSTWRSTWPSPRRAAVASWTSAGRSRETPATFGLVLGVWLIGFQIALPAYVFLYLFIFGNVRWWIALFWLLVFLVLIYGFFDLIIHIPWIDPVLGDIIPDVLKGRETITQLFTRTFG